MNAVDIVKQALAALEVGDAVKLSSLVADDMTFEGPVPKPMPKEAFLGMIKALVMAMPDWKFNASGYAEKGDKVTAMLKISGTHTGTLVLSALPAPIPATGKRVQLPLEPFEFRLKDGKINRIHVETVPGGGVLGLLEQLGASMTPA